MLVQQEGQIQLAYAHNIILNLNFYKQGVKTKNYKTLNNHELISFYDFFETFYNH